MFALIATVLVLVGGCSSTRHPTVAELRQIRGATATYPNTLVYLKVDLEGTFGVDGGDPAILNTEGCATGVAVRGLVIDWYEQTMSAAGWTPEVGSPQRLFAEDFDLAYSWRKGPRLLTLSFATAHRAEVAAKASGHPIGCPVVYQVLAQ